MTAFIKNELLSAAKRLNIDLAELDDVTAASIREGLLRKYGRDSRYELNANNLADHASVQHPDSWQWLSEYLDQEPVYFFYDYHDDSAMFSVPHGSDIVSILGECFAFVFYVTNKSLGYLLCQNDHDYLIGVGAAKEWVQSLSPRHEAWAASLGSSMERR